MSSGTLGLPGTLTAASPPASAELPIRLAATAVDIVLVGTVAVLAGLAAHLVIAVLPAAVAKAETWVVAVLVAAVVADYFVYFWGREGATPGKKLMGLTVTRPGTLDTRAPIGIGRAALRLIGMTAGNVLFVDLLVAFLHRDRRALHDLLADSIVVAAR